MAVNAPSLDQSTNVVSEVEIVEFETNTIPEDIDNRNETQICGWFCIPFCILFILSIGYTYVMIDNTVNEYSTESNQKPGNFFETCNDCPPPYIVLCIGIIVETLLTIFATRNDTKKRTQNENETTVEQIDAVIKTKQEKTSIKWDLKLFINILCEIWKHLQYLRLYIGFVSDIISLIFATEFASGWHDYQCMMHILIYSSNLKIFMSWIFTFFLEDWIDGISSIQQNRNMESIPETGGNAGFWALICSFFSVVLVVPGLVTHFIPFLFVYVWIALPFLCIFCVIFEKSDTEKCPKLCNRKVLAFVNFFMLISFYMLMVYSMDVMIVLYDKQGYIESLYVPYQSRSLIQWIQCLFASHIQAGLFWIDILVAIV